MREDEKVFNIGIGAAIVVVVLTAVLQVCYRTQDKARNRVRSNIVQIQKDLAESDALFSSLVRPEILRGLENSMYPNFVPIGFNKTISVTDIEFKNTDKI